ncbi:DEK carboxy-terminal domain protein [Arabidopsis thaliana]|nr:DEK carboxy-terminal domain protein [Arabidopsis thaliana]ANM60348.1 DEK carboxy-terminal domain protein [Arabidopsis thaliana]|eukprot:NP_001322643.1 DEK carboxy-terminal domain protein [Arabidopsis thaliana]
MDQLEKLMTDSIPHVVMPLEKGLFQVTEPLQEDEWIVQLSEWSCTCGEFQLKKFPCLHVLAVCEKLKINPLQYVDDCYSLDRLYKTYAATFSPVPEVAAWPEASGVPTLFPPVILPPPNVSVNDKAKVPPSDEELRNAIVDILKVVDLKTTAIADVLKRLAEKFEIDLTPRKSSIKTMIQNELSS